MRKYIETLFDFTSIIDENKNDSENIKTYADEDAIESGNYTFQTFEDILREENIEIDDEINKETKS